MDSVIKNLDPITDAIENTDSTEFCILMVRIANSEVE